MPEVSPIRPSEPSKAGVQPVVKPKDLPGNSARIHTLVQSAKIFEPKTTPVSGEFKVSIGLPENQFMALADTLEIDRSAKNLRFLKDYTNKEFIDELNAFKHLPLIDQAIKQITLSFAQWDKTEDHLNLEETLSNQFNNIEILIDVIADILPNAGDRVAQLRETPDLQKYLSGEERIEGEVPFKIRDHFLQQLG